jgi:cyclopropane fatty-acyl-phospholipid synthase-like methyltransferase
MSRWVEKETMLKDDYTSWIVIKDDALMSYRGKMLPMREAYEWYIRGKIEFTKPLLEVFLHRYQLFRFIFTMGHLHEIVWGVLGKAVAKHDAEGDANEIQPVYNLGNDFYHSFLADPMFYSCGVAYNSKDTLEVAQARKCGICTELTQLKDGDRVLDFGCGWGSWLLHCAKNFEVNCTGLTISKCQLEYANARIQKAKDAGELKGTIQLHLVDYREVNAETFGQFDKITNFEMSEHVGIRNYQKYMAQVKALLKDDGLFFLQIAGLRREWKYEDLIWGIFMGKYIFPGADASCPCFWNVNQVERGGFEVQTIRNQGVHYAHTIEMWYHNIVKNQEAVEKKYGQFAYRLHELFLAWSTMIARQGSSTVWLMVMTHQHKVDKYSSPRTANTQNKTAMFCQKERYTTKF